MEKRCFGCMKIKHSSPVCEHCGYDEREAHSPDRLPVGTRLRGRYTLGKTLGQGGFGITYIGWDEVLDIPLAVKEYFPAGMVMRDCTIDTRVHCYGNVREEYDKSKQRFLREAKTLAKLMTIPEIVRIQDFFEENDTAYIVMEYIHGQNLRDYTAAQGGKIPAEILLPMLKPAMEALMKVHTEGIVHRDISPDNIMLLTDGRTKLLDFGAVRYVENAGVEKALTHSTQAILKHGFAPIEQYQSKGSLGPWTDVYAMCGTIYYCLTGEVPPEASERIIEGAPLSWNRIPGLTEKQKEALEQGTAVLPKDRLRSVEELCDKLYDRSEELERERLEKERLERERRERERREKERLERERLEKERLEKERLEREKRERKAQKRKLRRQKQEGTVLLTGVDIPQIPEKKRKLWIPVIAAAVLALVFGIGILFDGRQEAKMSAPETTVPTATETTVPTETEPTVPTVTESIAGDKSKENMLMGYSNVAFNTGVLRRDIKSITFYDNLALVPADAVDASMLQNGKVKAWTVKEGELYNLYIAADGGVWAPEVSSKLFGSLLKLTQINFNNAFFTDNVTNMQYMFWDCQSLESLDLSGFDTSSVTNMSHMFDVCRSLKSLDVRSFDTSNVTNMSNMFYGCKSLKSLDLSSFDTSKVTGMCYMFNSCQSLTSLDLSNFDTSSVTDMSDMFGWCESLKSLDVRNFDTSKVTHMEYMFRNCRSLTSLDLSNFDTSNVWYMFGMFKNCNSLISLDLSGFDTSNVISMDEMFWNCSAPKPSWYKE